MDTVDIRRELETELGTATAPPLGSIVDDALATGRRLRSRNRMLTAVAAGAIVVLSGGAIAGAWMLRPAPSSDVAAPPHSAAATSNSAATTTTVGVGTGGPDGVTETNYLRQITALLLTFGAEVQDSRITVDETSADAVLTVVTAGGSGQLVVGFQAAIDEDPGRFQCHADGPPDCQVETINGATVRSLTLDGGELRVDAKFGESHVVYIEAAPGLLTREQGVAFVSDSSWAAA